MSLHIKPGSITALGFGALEWHTGEPMPNIGNARVATIQADGDELQLILTTMAMGWGGPGSGQAPSPTPETDELVAAVLERAEIARAVTDWVHVETVAGRLVMNVQAPEWERYVAADTRVRQATAAVVMRHRGVI